jgi:hypothetical protein
MLKQYLKNIVKEEGICNIILYYKKQMEINEKIKKIKNFENIFLRKYNLINYDYTTYNNNEKLEKISDIMFFWYNKLSKRLSYVRYKKMINKKVFQSMFDIICDNIKQTELKDYIQRFLLENYKINIFELSENEKKNILSEFISLTLYNCDGFSDWNDIHNESIFLYISQLYNNAELESLLEHFQYTSQINFQFSPEIIDLLNCINYNKINNKIIMMKILVKTIISNFEYIFNYDNEDIKIKNKKFELFLDDNIIFVQNNYKLKELEKKLFSINIKEELKLKFINYKL